MVRRLKALGVSYAQYLKSPRWADLVRRLRRDRCIACSGRRHLSLHHVTYVRLGCERDDDLVTVCGSCHSQIHEAAASGNYSLDPRDYRHLLCYRGEDGEPDQTAGFKVVQLPAARRPPGRPMSGGRTVTKKKKPKQHQKRRRKGTR